MDAWIDSLRQLRRYRKLFITGCAKSGTTWLVKLLNGHPQVVADGEGRFAWRLFSLLEQAANQFNQDQQIVTGSPLGMITGDDFAMMMRSASDNVLHRYLTASGKSPHRVQVIADKTPQHVFNTPILNAMYPGCRFINIVRDPRDVATSALFHLGKDTKQSKEEYVDAFINRSWRGSVEAALEAEKTLGSETFLNVRYEDLHADPEQTIRRCLTHLEVDASEETIVACREAGSFELLSGGRRRGETDPNSFYRNGQTGDWKNHLDSDLVKRCCTPVAGLMRRFGYPVDTGSVTVTLHVGATGKPAPVAA